MARCTHTHAATRGAHAHRAADARAAAIGRSASSTAWPAAARLTTLALSSLSLAPAQLTFILLFGLGSMAGMAAMAGLAGWPLARLVRNPAAAAAISVVTGLAAITFGVTYGQPLLASLLTR